MAAILIIGADAGGNVAPAVAIADEAARRGHTVTLAGHGHRAARTVTSGVELLPLESLADHDMTRSIGRLGQMRALGRLGTDKSLAREVGALIAERRPAAIVVDCIMLSSLKAALASTVPTTALFHTVGAFMLNAVRPPLSVVSVMLGLPSARLWAAARARILPTDRELDPAGEGASSIDFDWTGTTERGTPPAPRAPGEPPLVLVSLSSAWAPGQADAYRRIVTALSALPVRAIVTTGGAELEGELQSTANVEVREHVPHAELLPHADLVIGHGGHSTTLKALAHGVPLLILPINPLSDQTLMGRAIARHGLGRALRRTASVAELRAAVATILDDPSIREAAVATGERLRAQNGAATAVDLIETRCQLAR